MRIKVTFNGGKQYVFFHVGEPLVAFRRQHNCDAHYDAQVQRDRYRGLFGNIHLPKCEHGDPYSQELVVHEVTHMLADWLQSRGMKITDRNEERIATISGDVVGKFWKAYKKRTT